MQQLFSAKTLGAHIGLAEQTIYNRYSTGGDLPRAIKLGHLLRFRPADVESWLDTKRQFNAVATSQPATGQPSSGTQNGRPPATDQAVTELSQ